MADILLQTRFGFYDVMGIRVPTAILRIAATPVAEGYDVPGCILPGLSPARR